jgi:hypothetical protein
MSAAFRHVCPNSCKWFVVFGLYISCPVFVLTLANGLLCLVYTPCPVLVQVSEDEG